MTRIFNLILVGLMVASAIGVYSIKYESTMQAEKVAKLKHNIEAEKRAIEALNAEWAYISQPARLGDLSRRHLDLVAMKISQIVTLAQLPDKQQEGDPIAEQLQGPGAGGSPRGPQVTGSIR